MSVQKRQWADGRKPRYVARVSVGGRERSKSFPTRREALAWEREQTGKSPTGRRTDNQTLYAAYKAWMDDSTGSTLVQRRQLLNNLGDLADLQVGKVETRDVRRWRKLLGEGRPWAGGAPLSAGSISTLTRHLSAFFNDAVARDQITKNPVRGSRRGETREGEANMIDPAKVITIAQVKSLIAEADSPVDVMIELMATSGLRPNEVAGLRVRSVDFDSGSVHVTEQADGGEAGAWGWKPLKSAKSRRTVPLPESTLRRLEGYLAEVVGHPAAPLFLTVTGRQWSPSHFYRVFARAREAAGVPAEHSPKSLRHFYASKLIRSGESVAVVQARLGHASPMVTLSVYTHMWDDAADTTRAAVEGLF